MKNKLSIFEVISIITIITIAQIILDYPEYLIDLTGTGTIINLIFLSIICIFFCSIISKIFKHFSNHDIIDISEFIGGKFLKVIISIIFIIFLLLTTILTISNFLYFIKSIYFQNTHPLFIFSIFFLCIYLTALKGFYPLKRISTILFGILIFSIIRLIFGDNGNFNSNNIIPIFGYNYKTTFQLGFQNIFIFNFILFDFFLMPLLSKKNDYKKIVFSSLIINLLLLLLSIIAILLYYPTSFNKPLSELNCLNTILLVVRRIQISSFLSQTDTIFIFIWCFAILNYISILINGTIYILNKSFNYENKSQLSLSITSIILGGTFLINRLIIKQYLENNIFRFFAIILLFGISFGILILGYFKKRKEFLNAQNNK